MYKYIYLFHFDDLFFFAVVFWCLILLLFGIYVLLRAANVFGCGYLVNLVRPAHRKIPMTHQKALWYSGKILLFVPLK